MGSHPINIGRPLQTTSGNERPATAISMGSRGRDSVGAAQPMAMSGISNQHKPRRESLASSMVTGMSWGGNSVGSWIRDDIIMQGTSPFAYQSPSFHSSSYQPKLEADFMRDFSCCGLKLATLHDLLEHYEENHHEQLEDMNRQRTNEPPPDPKAAIASNAAAALKDPQRQSTSRADTPVQRTPTQATSANYPSQDEETVGDMEMDDDFSQMQYQNQVPNRMQFGPPRAPQLDMAAVNGQNALLQHQGLRNSTPTTPVSRNGYYHNNPTVSSVNTPTLTTHPTAQALQQQQYYTPDSSAPGTPAELEPEIINNMSSMNMSFMSSNSNTQPLPTNFDASNWGYAPTNETLDFCIDEPAKRLMADTPFNPGNAQPTSQPSTATTLAMPTTTATSSTTAPSSASAQQLGDGQYSENSELARTIREQQKLAGVPDPSADGVPKPFHCPVIGCEKAYKNQNGLKYHKSHGHNTQTLHSNANGTFSIVDPDTLQPYPGTKGMEKHKPYQCQTCGKRYKNLNGLKYHKAHTSTCDPQIVGVPGVGVTGSGGNGGGGGGGMGSAVGSGVNTPEGGGSKRSSLVLQQQVGVGEGGS